MTTQTTLGNAHRIRRALNLTRSIVAALTVLTGLLSLSTMRSDQVALAIATALVVVVLGSAIVALGRGHRFGSRLALPRFNAALLILAAAAAGILLYTSPTLCWLTLAALAVLTVAIAAVRRLPAR